VKYWQTALVILAALSASVAVAEDFKTVNGKEYKDAEVSRIEADGLVLQTKSGISKVYFTELPKEVQKRFGYEPDKAAIERRAAEEKRIQEQKAEEQEQAAREKNATDDLKRAVEQFQAAERRASQTYQSAGKGTLSGQVFVSGDGLSFKLGAVQVALFTREAIDTLLPAIKKYADYKIQQLSRAVAEAKAAQDQAEATESAARDAVTRAQSGISRAQLEISELTLKLETERMGKAADEAVVERDAARAALSDAERMRKAANEAVEGGREPLEAAQNKCSELRNELSVYYSGAFYFEYLKSPIQTAETDADGRFVIQIPRTGAFVIATQGEHCYWLQPVSLEGKQQLTQNLSNSNLTSTTGTSSLIFTKD
jgi:hypothetical protein